MPDNTKRTPEVQVPKVDAKESQKPKIDTAVEKKLEQQAEIAAKVDTLDAKVNATEQQALLSAQAGAILEENKGQVQTTFLEKAKAKGGEVRDWAKKNWAVVAGGIGGFLGIRRLRNKFKGDDKKDTEQPAGETRKLTKEEREKEKSEGKSGGTTVVNVQNGEKKNWFQRNRTWLIGGAGVAGAGYYFRDKLKNIPVIGDFTNWLGEVFQDKNDVLNIQDAITKVKSDLNVADENALHIKPNIVFHESTGEFESYGQKVKLDIKNKTIEGMDFTFSTLDELFHAANLINFSTVTFRGKCKSAEPFSVTPLGGDIEVQLLSENEHELVSGSGFPVGKVAGGLVATVGTAAATFYSRSPKLGGALALGAIPGGIIAGDQLIDKNDTLSKILPSLNDKVAKEKFRARLNRIPNLTPGKQEKKDDTTTPLHPELNKLIQEIENTKTDSEFEEQGKARQLDAIPDPKNPDKYHIKSWNQETLITFKNNQIQIEGLDIAFNTKEGLNIANLTNKIKSDNAGQGSRKNPFIYSEGLLSQFPGFPGIYMSTKDFNDNRTKWRKIIKGSTFETGFSLTYANKEKYIDYLNGIKVDGKSLRI